MDSCLQDSSEDEVFFGAVHSVEKRGRSNMRHDTTINEMDFSPMKISKQLDRSNHSLLSADNSIPEESEDEDEDDIEVERRSKSGGYKTTSISMGEEEKRTSSSGNKSGGEARTSQASSEGWETESETSCMDVSSSLDATEMEVSVEISGIVPLRDSNAKSSSGVFEEEREVEMFKGVSG